MTEAVDWALAAKVASRVSGTDPLAQSYRSGTLAADVAEFTPLAQQLVEAETGWPSTEGPARARVVDRSGWVQANIGSFQRLLEPLLERMSKNLSGPSAVVGPKVAAAEMGVILGWMSRRVLGQYDLLVTEPGPGATGVVGRDAGPDGADPDGPAQDGAASDRGDQDVVYLVGPNLLALERKYGFPPREFRLWVCVHELTHRAQFTGVEWLRPYFLAQVRELLDAAEPDPARLLTALGRLAEAIRTGTNPLNEGGLSALFAGPEQRAAMDRLAGLMSLLEGHGDIVMNRAAGDRIPSSERFHEVLSARRNAAGPAALFQKLLGMEAKMRQYEEGERFIEAVEERHGRAGLDRAFESPETVPTLTDIRDPEAWMARVKLTKRSLLRR
ncbi:MAG: zinc-dependent metalloprotease [Microthrixaceae bacterium]